MNNSIIIVAIIYVLGFLLTYFWLILFGRKYWIDYDPPHPNWYDDYESNATAYPSQSLIWPLLWIMAAVIGIGRGATWITQKLLDYTEKSTK